MQDSLNVTEADLGGLGWDDWRERLHDVAGEDGFAEPLGSRHAAVFVEHKPVLLVTFESYGSIQERSEAGHPLGWQMRDALGWSHLCLVSQGDTWFRDRHVYGFFDRLIDDGFFEEFDQVLFYGAGPCGYAAAAFSVASPGARVLALQPQATLDPRVAEWDDRYRHMRRTDFTSRFGYAPDMLDAAEQAYVVYDPEQELDAMHAALFTRANVTKVRARFFGLDLQTMLLQLEVLYRMLAQISAGKFNVGNRARLLRTRRANPAYQFNLLRQLQQRDRHGLVMMLCRNVLERRNARPFRKALREAEAALNARPHRDGAAAARDAGQNAPPGETPG
ncbi:phosphoadenosine phosphosulfate reductase [Roseovarius salis]|uniref:phosphoadenosine phosphosulfate reductase n=1 Tax=Roseovarius salis TaxID=3376063 RepID=UPI0037C7D19E